MALALILILAYSACQAITWIVIPACHVGRLCQAVCSVLTLQPACSAILISFCKAMTVVPAQMLIIAFVATRLLTVLSAKLGILWTQMTSALLAMKVAWSVIQLDSAQTVL